MSDEQNRQEFQDQVLREVRDALNGGRKKNIRISLDGVWAKIIVALVVGAVLGIFSSWSAWVLGARDKIMGLESMGERLDAYISYNMEHHQNITNALRRVASNSWTFTQQRVYNEALENRNSNVSNQFSVPDVELIRNWYPGPDL